MNRKSKLNVVHTKNEQTNDSNLLKSRANIVNRKGLYRNSEINRSFSFQLTADRERLKMKPKKICSNIWLAFASFVAVVCAESNETKALETMEIGEMEFLWICFKFFSLEFDEG